MAENPIGLNGIEFVEFSSSNPQNLRQLFQGFGFAEKNQHQSLDACHFGQGNINLILNYSQGTFAHKFCVDHGPSISSMGWRVANAQQAMQAAVARGAVRSEESDFSIQGQKLPAIKGIGGSLIYFIDQAITRDLYPQIGFTKPVPNPVAVEDKGFIDIDHLTNNVEKGTMEQWSRFYKEIFGFYEVRYFDIKGAKTGLTSYALKSPCGHFCIPINEGNEEKSQINEYLREYRGPGVQHLAFTTNDIIATVAKVQGASIETLDIDADYYDHVFERVPHVKEDHAALRKLNILVDGDEEGYLLQIFTKNVIGPIFIEIIQRHNHYSFGEGNFGALFRAIERDQEKRGVL